MDQLVPALVLFLGGVFAWRLGRRYSRSQRTRLIDSYRFPATIRHKVVSQYPHLSEADSRRVMAGLREYFHLCHGADGRMVAMPSQAVDLAWHEFILFTRQYQTFCHRALGRFVHHTPAEAMRSATSAQQGIKTAWRLSCKREQIKVHAPQRLPLLFALDSDLNIPDGFRYSLNCQTRDASGYCASHIGCGSGCSSGSSSGCAGGSGCSADSGSGCSSCGGD
jgi:hypothetical protein